jgi:hypothetical protein
MKRKTATPDSPSYPAKAGYPVIANVSDGIETSVITGSSAFADDDVEFRVVTTARREKQ